MAEHSSQDVVNQVRSTGAFTSVDVSASTNNTLVAAAAPSSAPITSSTENEALALDKTTDGANIHFESDKISRGGRATPNNPVDIQNPESFATNGVQEEHGPASQENENASAPGSVGQSADSDSDLRSNDAPDSASKAGDVPRYTVKKTSTFKPVSMTKNFLAKAGTPPSQLVKSTSEILTPTSATSGSTIAGLGRPRLVAKTGSGHKLSMSTQLSNGNRSARNSGPDPMQVWNKNRVQTPQATPKHLTDEELRQQYGIQLASIPIGDGDEKGNKWADIDDEEDDWAPDVIEWADGSKVNLAEVEKAAAEKAELTAETKRQDEAAKAPTPAKPISSLGPKATILKIGGAVQAKSAATDSLQQGVKLGDKPTLVAKPSAPTPVKSPWAPLPPVEKVPPVTVQSSIPGHSQLQLKPDLPETQVPDRGSAPWRPAKEIAADDFSRIPRDAVNGMPRELFNSQSGKYEPVNEGRRGSMKRDQNFRQPSVLQRPGPDHETPPLLPQGDSEDRQAGVIPEEQTSSVADPADRHISQESSATQSWRRQPGNWVTGQPSSDPQPSTIPSPGIPSIDSTEDVSAATHLPVSSESPQEDPVAVQKRLMHQKREEARKRRLEQEAKEEAERKERIKKKLEAMGPPPEKKEKDKEKPDNKEAFESTSKVAAVPEVGEDVKLNEPRGFEDSRSPPKPPVPMASGPPQQYGMMKVHPSPLPHHVTPAAPSLTAEIKQDNVMERQLSDARQTPQTKRPMTNTLPEKRPAVKSPLEQSRNDILSSDSRWNMSQASKAWDRAGDSGAAASVNSNMWAHPGTQRNLGNGDFNLNSSRQHFRQTQPQVSPENILPSPQSVSVPVLFGEDKGPSPPVSIHQPSGFARQFDAGPTFAPKIPPSETHPQPPTTQSRTPALPSPLAHGHPVQLSVPPAQHQLTALAEMKTGVSAWNSFSNSVAEHDASARAKMNHESMVRVADAEARGQSSGRIINEKWKQAHSSEEIGGRKLVGVHSSTRAQIAAQQGTQPTSSLTELSRQPAVSMPTQHPRASKFQGLFSHQDQALQATAQAQALPVRSPSPPIPPPDSALHPAFERVSNRPLVNLPGSRPRLSERPIVRLPPPKAMPQHPVVAELRGMPPPLRGPHQPLAKNPDWQHRFDGLLNRNTDRKSRPEAFDFSISKTGFDILSVSEAAAVNFPQPGQISPSFSLSFSVQSEYKSVEDEEELFDGEQDPGSTPIVRVPESKFPANWRPAPSPPVHKNQLGEHNVISRVVWIVGLENFINGLVHVPINLPGMELSTVRTFTPTYLPYLKTKIGSHLKSKPHQKQARKPKEAPIKQSSSHTLLGKSQSTATMPPVAPSIPQTWAKRISQVAL